MKLFPSTAFQFNIHEFVPEPDQFPQDWNNWKVSHDYDQDTGLKTNSFKITNTKDEKGHRYWPLFTASNHTVKAVAIKHRIPCYGFVIDEHDQLGTLDVEKAKNLGVQQGPLFGKLKNGETVTAENGQKVKPEQVLGESIKGRKIGELY